MGIYSFLTRTLQIRSLLSGSSGKWLFCNKEELQYSSTILDLTVHQFCSLYSQRYQYKLKQEGKHSTLSDEREERLSQVGFIWGSHAACWQEHFQSLESFVMAHGHCCVPTDYKPDSSLAVWCKHQRRQFKRFQQGQTSTMTEERYKCLQSIGFEWNPRSSSSRAKKVID